MDARLLGRLHHFLVRRISLAYADITLNGVRKEPYILHNDADRGKKIVVGDVPHVHAADAHASRIYVPESQQKVGQCALARPGLAYECRHSMFGDRKRCLGQLKRVPSIGETHLIEPNRVQRRHARLIGLGDRGRSDDLLYPSEAIPHLEVVHPMRLHCKEGLVELHTRNNEADVDEQGQRTTLHEQGTARRHDYEGKVRYQTVSGQDQRYVPRRCLAALAEARHRRLEPTVEGLAFSKSLQKRDALHVLDEQARHVRRVIPASSFEGLGLPQSCCKERKCSGQG